MRKVIKKGNSKWILLFLLTFISFISKAQYDENERVISFVEKVYIYASDEENPNKIFYAKNTITNERVAFSINTNTVQVVTVDPVKPVESTSNVIVLDEVIIPANISRVELPRFSYSYYSNLWDHLSEYPEMYEAANYDPDFDVFNIIICSRKCSSDEELTKDCECERKPESKIKPCRNAELADHVYNTKDAKADSKAPPLPRGTTIVPQNLLPAEVKLTDSNTGFNSALYKVTQPDGKIEFVYATAGTDDRKDALHDVIQATGFESAQYK